MLKNHPYYGLAYSVMVCHHSVMGGSWHPLSKKVPSSSSPSPPASRLEVGTFADFYDIFLLFLLLKNYWVLSDEMCGTKLIILFSKSLKYGKACKRLISISWRVGSLEFTWWKRKWVFVGGLIFVQERCCRP
jgi:hypothetical protein